ncbi:aspartate kinase [Geosporobacter ferrireducens]|uniref:Aspartokinase n=1 Tax=Geosporobacter ferrireducens TaxID=1424294 RepID=A0A1D8GBE1_9FIRM|nr:aspartate kinase [Geosporobacter ferrireducens]AOT68224.1 aspartate kinase [Geosporobacter ferrireducens]MTI57357.1 aspartate kinase [Geosporobacter ferrireducens]
MNIIVQKFGGTSVATEELRNKAVDKVIGCIQEGKQPVVVVSAMGRKGEPYATDTLLQIGRDPYQEYTSRELDLIMACGETISSVIFANTIKSRGYKAAALMGFQAGIITDEKYGDADVIKVESQSIIRLLENGIIPVITGFQGISESGNITTLGRGGSDTSAAVIGEALKAELVEIYTDVDGIMTADPRLVTQAKVIDQICYDEIYQMAEDGAKVIHPRAVEVARRGSIVLKIKNTFTNAPGTVISSFEHYENKYSKYPSIGECITAIAHKNNIAQVIVQYEDASEANEIFMSALAENDISIDMINFFIDKKIFTVEEQHLAKLESILRDIGLKYDIHKNCSKITTIGHKMRGVPGVMARIVKALAKENIKILQTSDSYTTISCLVSCENMEKSVNLLHQEFQLA